MEDNTFGPGGQNESKHRAKIREAIEEAERTAERNAAMLMALRDLTYPESKDGSTLDISFFSTIVAWHMVRCGWRPIEEKRMIKPRRLVAKGLPPDAVRWVGVDEPDDLDYSTMTLAEIHALEPRERAIAMRALGGPETPDLPSNPGWRVQTNINIQDAPDPGDDKYSWTGREYRK